MAKMVSMRGLQLFISDIRACQNKEQEAKRVEKELAKIRARFGEDKPLTPYDRKKYVWKLLYIYMLGYDVEFGHKQACDLIPAQKYSEKQVGYMACSLLLNENDEFLRLAINAIHMDLISRNESFQCLALTFCANVGGQEVAESLTQDVLKLLTGGASRPIIKKKAALALLKMIRKTPLDSQVVQPDTFSAILTGLLEERDIGVLICSVTLLYGICSRTSSAGYETCQSRLIKILERLVYLKDVPADCLYYGIASPWLQCKTLRALQYFPPPDTAAGLKALHDAIQAIIVSCGDGASSKNVNKSNAQHAILFDAIMLCLHLDTDRNLLSSCVAALGKFLTVKEANIKYLALENMARLALVPEIVEAIRHQQATVVASLKDPDVSLRKRALDLLFTMCDQSNSGEIVDELLKYLTVAELSMREELVLKVAILAEKFAPSVAWYVDVVLALLERAGEHVSDDIWHRVVQLLTNNETMQEYAAKNVVEVLKRGAAHEPLVCTAAYVLGEYGRLAAPEVTPLEQFRLLHGLFPAASNATKGLLMSAFLKLYLLQPDDAVLRGEVLAVYERYSRQVDADLQQRAVEYKALAERPGDASAHYVLAMPKWEERESSLLRRLQQQQGSLDLEEASSLASSAAMVAATSRGLSSTDGALPTPPVSSNGAAPAEPPLPPPPPVEIDLLGGVDDLAYGNGSVAAPAPAAAPADLDPLAELLGVPIAPSAPVSVPQRSPFSSLDGSAVGPSDPFGGPPAATPSPFGAPAAAAQSPFGAPPAAAHSAVPAHVGPPPGWAVLGDVAAWCAALLVKERGVLYEDTFLQIGCQARFTRSRGELVLFLGNKHGEELASVQLLVAPTPAVQAVVGPVPPSLAPKQQLQVPLQVTCLEPFLEPPALMLAYTLSGHPVSTTLPLPLANIKFLTPEPTIPKEVFFDNWKHFSGPPFKQQEMVQRSSPVGVEPVIAMLRALNLGVEHLYLDPTPNNEAAAATFLCGAPPAEQALLCLVRVEGNPANRMQFRVTTATPNAVLASAVKDAVVQQLLALP